MRTLTGEVAGLPVFFQNKSTLPKFRTVVSLHGHTLYSRESLGFINALSRKVPLIRVALERGAAQYRRVKGTDLDLTRAWWTPPLAPYGAWRLEADRITSQFGAHPLVSLSDHDDIEAGVTLRVLEECSAVPVSVEWTVPFGGTFFHMGVHNLPPDEAREIMAGLRAFTANPVEEGLHDLFAALDAHRSVLIVFNHPCWDECEVGRAAHMAAARRFVAAYGSFLHAFEINGLRPWEENRRAIDFAIECGKPVISGGDRHALEPNTVLNLTNAGTFEEFVAEVRDGRSQVLVTTGYTEPFALRILHNISQILAYREDHGMGWRRWSDRVFYTCDDGVVRSLSEFELWKQREPVAVAVFVRGVRILHAPPFRGAFRTMLGGRRGVAL
jgi:hypothetical protein